MHGCGTTPLPADVLASGLTFGSARLLQRALRQLREPIQAEASNADPMPAPLPMETPEIRASAPKIGPE